MRNQPIAFLLALALAVGFATGAEAQQSAEPSADVEARRLFAQGRDAYERELFTEAEDAFAAAYAAMPEGDERRSLILLNVAQAIERQGGRDADALETWKRFEREARDVAEADILLRASRRIRELEARQSRRDEPSAAQSVEPMPAAEPLEPAELEQGGRRPHWSGIALTSVGGAMILAGGAVGIVGLAKRKSVIDTCEGTLCPESARDDADQLVRFGRAADALLWPGLALAAVGTVLMFTVDVDDEGTVTASCGATGCNLVGRF